MRLRFEHGYPGHFRDVDELSSWLDSWLPAGPPGNKGFGALLVDLSPTGVEAWEVFKPEAELALLMWHWHSGPWSTPLGQPAPVGGMCIHLARAFWAEAEGLEIARVVESNPAGRSLVSRL